MSNNDKNVLTPFGPRPADKVHAVPKGGQVAHVNDEIQLKDADGNVLHVAKNENTKVGAGVPAQLIPERSNAVTYAEWTNDSRIPVKSFTSVWNVPDPPIKDEYQTLFLLISMEPASGYCTLEPVLQWGRSAAGGGSYWAVASWYLVGDDVYFTPLVTVESGQTLYAEILLTGQIQINAFNRIITVYNYSSSFTNIPETYLAVGTFEELVWLSESLEACNVKSDSDYPRGSTKFYPINVRLNDGSIPPVTWVPLNPVVGGPTTTVIIQGGSDAEVTITYPTPN